MTRPGPQIWQLCVAYVLAVALPAATIHWRLAEGFDAGAFPALTVFLIPIALCAIAGGFGPGLLATGVTGLLTKYFLIVPLQSFSLTTALESIAWASMIAVGIIICVLAESANIGRWGGTTRRTASECLLPDIGPRSSIRPAGRSTALVFVFMYVAIASTWILGLDWLLGKLVGDIHTAKSLGIYTDSIFVIVSAAVFGVAARRNLETIRRSELSLEDNRARLAGIVGSAMDGIITVDEQQRIVLLNPAAETMFQYKAADLLGKSLDVLIPLRSREAHREDVREFGQSGTTRRTKGQLGSVTGLRADGTEFPIEASISRVDIAGQKLFTVILRDISERKRVERLLNTQFAVARVLSEMPGFEEAASGLLEAIATNLGFQVGMLWEFDPKAGMLRCAGAWHAGSPALRNFVNAAREMTIPLGVGIAGQAWADANPIWERDVAEFPDLVEASTSARSALTTAGLHTAAAFPIVIGGKVHGVVDFFSADRLEPDPEVLKMFSTFSSQIGQFMERRTQEFSILKLNRVYAMLSGINSAIIRIRDRQELFTEVCRIAVREGWFSLAWLGLLDPDTRTVKPAAIDGDESDFGLFADPTYSEDANVDGGRGTVGEALRTKSPVYSNDLLQERWISAARDEAIRRGYRSVISVPLLIGGDCAGIFVLYSKERGFFDEEELVLLKELADDISFSLDFIASAERITFLAFRDPMTGLANRFSLRERLAQVVEESSARRSPLALMLMNINNFRDINDSLGHQNGDALLGEIAGRLKSALWGSDMVASLGGDEYAILLPRLADKADIELVTRKINEALHEPFVVAGLPVNVEPRLGIALYPDHGDSPDLLWQHADVALRAAKEQHQTNVFYRTDIDRFDPQRLSLLGEFHGAMDRDELLLHYQPKIDLKTGRTVGVEALIRWLHPERGMIYPDAFVPLVERTSLINRMTSWVLGDALRQGSISGWSGYGLELSVNLSAHNLQNPDLTREILDLARRVRYPLDRLTFEITESAIMADPARARAVLSGLRDTGIRFAMDDFGIGQSSLSYLKDLPIREVKIDKSFVTDFREPRNAAIVRAAIELGHNLELSVTAEGIEDETTYLALHDLGCDCGQGYYFNRPLPVEELMQWLKSSRWKAAV